MILNGVNPGERETLEQWVERVNKDTFREVAIRVASEVGKLKREAVVKSAIDTFANDLFSLKWDSLPREVCVEMFREQFWHANTYVISARKKVTRECPSKEKLWVALRRMYEECKALKNQNDYLSSLIEELRAELDEREPGGLKNG